MSDKVVKMGSGTEDLYIRDEDGKILTTKASVARIAAIIRAEPGSALRQELESRPERPGITEEEHRRIMSDPRWYG